MSLKKKLEDAHDQGADAIRHVVFVSPFAVIEAMIKLPALFLLQYVFFWNWRRIIDPDTWQVVVTGLAMWGIVIITAVLMVVYG